MCTLVILWRPGTKWPVMVGANRDELIGRSWKSPDRHWPDHQSIVGGRDNLAGGTWLGINDAGLFAGVLNRQNSLGPKDGFRSRGELPLKILECHNSEDAAEVITNLNPELYRPFNMVFADSSNAYWFKLFLRNDSYSTHLERVPVGVSIITSGDLNDLSSPRIRAYLPKFRTAREPDPETGNWSDWKLLLSSSRNDRICGSRGGMVLPIESGFGTISSSLIALPSTHYVKKNSATRPIFLFAPGSPVNTQYKNII